LAWAKRLRSKLNHAVEATDVKLAASKTALGLHSAFTFPDHFEIHNGNLLEKYSHQDIFPRIVKNVSLRFNNTSLRMHQQFHLVTS
jgi:hypothetical protein